MLLFCPLCSLCFKGVSKEWARARRRSGRGRTHEEKYCPQRLFSASQWRNKNRTTKLPPDAKEGRSEQKTIFFKRRRGRKGEAKEKGKRVEAGFEVREKAVLREWRRVLNEGKSTAERTRKYFIRHQEEIKTNREGKRKREQEHSKVRARDERRGRKEGARQVEKEKEQMRLRGYTCSL